MDGSIDKDKGSVIFVNNNILFDIPGLGLVCFGFLGKQTKGVASGIERVSRYLLRS